MRKYEGCRKLTEQQLAEMKKLHSEGISYCKLAKKFNVALSTIQWHLGTKKHREGVRKKVKKHFLRYKEKHMAEKKKWLKEHRDLQYRSMCFSMIRLCLKRGYITKADVLDVLGEFEN